MEELIEISARLIEGVDTTFKRYLYHQIDWKNRLIGIKGARGTGKSTLVLQVLKEKNLPRNQVAYLSLDDLFFTHNSLLQVAQSFYERGGKVLVLDEVHKYPKWSLEIKNLYDRYPDFQVIFTGSSIIEITKQEADLSRRMIMYELKGLSYREFLMMAYGISLPIVPFEELIQNPSALRAMFPQDFKPLAHFEEYLKFGYYPFYFEDKHGYYQRINQLIRTIVEYDMAEIKGFDIRHAKKMLQLLYVVSRQVPFKPNIQQLANKTGIHRNSINNYLYFLQEAKLLDLLYAEGISIAGLKKPEKVFLNNTNLLYALSTENTNKGTAREIFFNNQLNTVATVNHGKTADFFVNDKYTFEIGGKNKNRKQIVHTENAYLVKDEAFFPLSNTLPLWIFGFLY